MWFLDRWEQYFLQRRHQVFFWLKKHVRLVWWFVERVQMIDQVAEIVHVIGQVVGRVQVIWCWNVGRNWWNELKWVEHQRCGDWSYIKRWLNSFWKYSSPTRWLFLILPSTTLYSSCSIDTIWWHLLPSMLVRQKRHLSKLHFFQSFSSSLYSQQLLKCLPFLSPWPQLQSLELDNFHWPFKTQLIVPEKWYDVKFLVAMNEFNLCNFIDTIYLCLHPLVLDSFQFDSRKNVGESILFCFLIKNYTKFRDRPYLLPSAFHLPIILILNIFKNTPFMFLSLPIDIPFSCYGLCTSFFSWNPMVSFLFWLTPVRIV